MQHKTTQVQNLTSNEIELIQLMRSGQYNSILIKIKDDQPNSVELCQTHATNRRIVDILQDDPFQTITIKTHRGRIAHLESTHKQKLA